MIKEYEKKYEDYPIIEYTCNGIKKLKCEIDKVSNRSGMDVDEYILKIKDEAWVMERELFIRAVRMIWLVDQFGYSGNFRARIVERKTSPGILFDSAIGSFLQYYVGIDNRLFFQSEPFQVIRSYLDDWCPNIRQDNPFESEIKYPYEYMNLGCAAFVRRMPDRMELLKIGEERKMTFATFINYVVNYIFCYNEEHGETYFIYTPPRTFCRFPFIRLVKK